MLLILYYAWQRRTNFSIFWWSGRRQTAYQGTYCVLVVGVLYMYIYGVNSSSIESIVQSIVMGCVYIAESDQTSIS